MIDWERDVDGKPKEVKPGTFVLNQNGSYFKVTLADIDRLFHLIDELDLI